MFEIYFGEPPEDKRPLLQETEATVRGGDTGAPLGSLSPLAEDALNGLRDEDDLDLIWSVPIPVD